MKTTIEIQHEGLNILDVNIEKYVKEVIKERGIKMTDVTNLNIYYTPASSTLYYVVNLTDGTEVKGNIGAFEVPEYKEVVKAPAKPKAVKKAKAAPKKAAAKPAAKKAAKKAPAKAKK